jgi:hypothetical protein
MSMGSKEDSASHLPLPDRKLLKKENDEADQKASITPTDSKRKRVASTNGNTTIESNPEPPYPAATDEEKREWQGFCEIESDPVSLTLPMLLDDKHYLPF